MPKAISQVGMSTHNRKPDMLKPSCRFDLPFTCIDSTGAPAAPTGTPTGTLVKNGIDQGTTVTVTMAGAQGIASCIIPGDAVAGDRFYLRISAVISAVTYVVCGQPDSIASPQTLTSDYDPAKTPAPTAATNAAAVRTELATELARIDASISSRLAATSYVSPPSVAGLATSASISSLTAHVESLPNAAQIASEILISPAHKLLTDDEGRVTATNGGDSEGGGNYSTFVMPLRATSLERVQANRIDLFVRERVPLTISIYDAQQQAVDCTGLICTLFVEGGIEIPSLVPTSDTSDGPANRYSFTPPESLTAAPATRWFSLRVNDDSQRVLAFGHLVIAQVP